MQKNFPFAWPHFLTALPLTLLLMFPTSVEVLAGSIDSPAAPTDSASQMYTLEDIHERLSSGTAAGKMTSFTEPTSGPGNTMHTLDEIMALIPDAGANVDGADGSKTFNIPDGVYRSKTATCNDSDLISGNILDGVVILGVTGNIPARDNVDGADGAKTFNIPDGYYSGKTATCNDSALIPGNILDSATVLGVTGNIPTQGNVDGSDGAKTFTIPDGYYSGKTATCNDSDLIPGNILDGVTVLGVTGDIPTQGNVEGANHAKTFNIPDGFYSGKTATCNDVYLQPYLIKDGFSIFGVTGTFARTGNATQTDVYYTKTFSNSGSSGLTGTRYGGCVCTGTIIDNRWCNNGDGTVTDLIGAQLYINDTQNFGQCLVWLKNANCSNGSMDWAAALSWSSEIEDGICDVSGGPQNGSAGAWRLPTRFELEAITTGNSPVSATNPRAFDNIQAANYWTVTAVAGASGIVYKVDLNNCNPDCLVGTAKTDNLFSAWAVRTGP